MSRGTAAALARPYRLSMPVTALTIACLIRDQRLLDCCRLRLGDTALRLEPLDWSADPVAQLRQRRAGFDGLLLERGALDGENGQLLRDSGLLNQALLAMGVISAPVQLLYSTTGLLLGMVHSYLPFALLPLYAALAARDMRLEEAAADLGAGPFTVFRSITLPGSMAAAAAAFLLVFIPAAGEFVIPALLGAPDALLAGGAIWQEFFTARDWPLAGAASIALLAALLPPLLLWQRLGRR